MFDVVVIVKLIFTRSPFSPDLLSPTILHYLNPFPLLHCTERWVFLLLPILFFFALLLNIVFTLHHISGRYFSTLHFQLYLLVPEDPLDL